MRQQYSDDAETSTSKAYEAMYKPSKKAIAVLTPLLWKNRYIAQMLKDGVTEENAQSYYEDVEFGTHFAVYDLYDDPEEAAKEDILYG